MQGHNTMDVLKINIAEFPFAGFIRRALQSLVLLLTAYLVLLPGPCAAALNGGDPVWTSLPNNNAFRDGQEHTQFPVASLTDSSGNTYITGWHQPAGVGQLKESYTVKVDNNGALVWRRHYKNAAFDVIASALAVDGNGNVYVTGVKGNSAFVIMYAGSTVNGSDIYAAPDWEKLFEIEGKISEATAIAVDGGAVYVGGTSNVQDGLMRYMLLKYNADGSGGNTPLWQIPDSSNISPQGTIQSLAVSGAILAVTGQADASAGGVTIKYSDTIRYNISDGGKVWEQPATVPVSSMEENGLFLKIDSLGHIVVSGSVLNGVTHGIYTAKYCTSSDGPCNGTYSATPGAGNNRLWGVTYNSVDALPKGLSIDKQTGSTLDDVYLTGTITQTVNQNIYTVRYRSADGTLAWPAPVIYSSGSGNNDTPTAIVASDSEDNLFVAGTTDFQSGNIRITRWRLVKYRKSSGNQVWTTDFHGTTDYTSVPVGIGLDSSGQVYAAGFVDETIRGSGAAPASMKGSVTDQDAVSPRIILWDSNKNGSWTTTDRWKGYYVTMTGGAPANTTPGVTAMVAASSATSLTLTNPGMPASMTVGDSYYIYDQADYDCYVAKFDKGIVETPSGLTAATDTSTAGKINLSWTDNTDPSVTHSFRVERCIAGSDHLVDPASCFADSNLYTTVADNISGTTASDTTAGTPDKYYYYRVIAFNTDHESYPSSIAHAITQYNQQDAITDPTPNYTYRYNGVANMEDYALAVAAGPDGNPVVTGRSIVDHGTGGDYDYYTVKLDRSLMTSIWNKDYDGNEAGDVPACVAVNSLNQIMVSGYSYLVNTNVNPPFGLAMDSIYTLKYDPTLNQQKWGEKYNPASAGFDSGEAVAMAVDANDNAAVVGKISNTTHTPANYDIYVIYYPAGDSQPAAGFWVQSYDSGFEDEPTAVTFDDSGNVIVTGFTTNSQGKTSILTAKYDKKGYIQWGGPQIYDGGHGDDAANDVAVDELGNIYVTGFTTNAAGNTDFITIKYGPDGTLLWHKEYNGPVGGDDEAVSIKYDPIDRTVVAAGSRVTDFRTGQSINDNRDIHVIRYYTSGRTLNSGSTVSAGDAAWQKTLLRESSDDDMIEMAMDKSGNVFVTANTTTISNGDQNILIFKVDYLGNISGHTKLYGAGNTTDKPYGIVANHLGEAFVAGMTQLDANTDYIVLKLDGDTLQPPAVTSSSTYSTTTLNWSNNSKQSDGFQVARQDGACPSYDYDWNGITPADMGIGTLTWGETGLPNGASYCYGVRAKNGSSYSRWVNSTVTTSTPPGPIFTPMFYLDLPNIAAETVPGSSPPINYGARASSTASVRLTWGAPAYLQTPTGYEIYRCADVDQNSNCSSNPANFTLISPTQTQTYQTIYGTTYTNYSAEDTTVCPGIGYRYKIRATGSGWSADSVTVGVILPTPDNLVVDGSFESIDPGNPWYNAAGSNVASIPHTYAPNFIFPNNSVFGAWGYSGKGIRIDNDTSVVTGNADWNRTSTPNAATVGAKTATVGDNVALTYQGWQSKKSLTGLTANAVNQAQISRDATSTDGTEPQYGYRDLRIYDTVNNVELPTLFVNGMAGTPLTVWFKTGDNTTGIYAYYGNRNAQKSDNAVMPISAIGRRQPILLLANGKYELSAQVKASLDHGMLYVNVLQQGYPYSTSGGNITANTDSRIVIDSSNNAGSNVLNHAFNNDGNWHLLSQTVTANSTSNPSGNSYQYIRTYIAPSPCDYIGNTTCSTTSGSAVAGSNYPAFYASGSAFVDDVKLTPLYNLAATRQSEMQINLAWVNSSFDATGYKVERCTGACGYSDGAWSGTWSPVATVTPATTTSYNDTGLLPDVTYYYRIYPYKTFPQTCGSSPGWNGSGWSGNFSNIASAVTTNDPPVSTALTTVVPNTTIPNTTQVSLGWSDTTTTETAFQIERCTAGDSSPTCSMPQIMDTGFPLRLAAGSMLFTDNAVCTDTSYEYQVKSLYKNLSNGNGGVWSNRTQSPLGFANFPAGGNKLARIGINSQLAGMDINLKDIRFYDATAQQELPYWIEYLTTSPMSARIWFMTGANNNIYLYYGNPSATSNSNKDAVFGPGMAGDWSFSTANLLSGNVADTSGNYMNGSLTGFTSGGTVAGGYYGTGLALDGAGYMSIADKPGSSVLDISGSMSIEFWYKYDSTSPAGGRLVSKSVNGGVNNQEVYGIFLDGASNNQLRFQVNSSNTPSGVLTSPLSTQTMTNGTWYHVAGRYDTANNEIAIFVNGAKTAAAITPVAIAASNEPLIIGSRLGSADFSKGVIDEIRIFNRPLTDAEIASRYSSPSMTVPAITVSTAVTSNSPDYFQQINAWDGPYSGVATVRTPAPFGAAAAGNLIANSGFESGLTSWTLYSGGAITTNPSVDAGTAYSGANSAMFTLDGTQSSFYIKSASAAVTAGATYVFSMASMNGLSQGNITGSVDWLTSGGSVIATATPFQIEINGNGGWQYVNSGPLIAPATATQAYVYFGGNSSADLNPSGTIRIDAVRLIKMPALPITSFTATALNESQIKLTWSAPSTNGDHSGFNIDRCIDSACATVQSTLNVPNATATTYTDTGLNYGTQYWYRIRAYKSAACPWETSSYATIATATTKTLTTAKPTGLSVTNSAATVYVNCDDIRFADTDGTHTVPHFLESGCGTADTRFIANFPAILPANNNSQPVYLYYGNPSAPNRSNGYTTFPIFFEGFDGTGTNIDTAKWAVSGSSYSLGSGNLTANSSNSMILTSLMSFGFNDQYNIESKVRGTSIPSAGFTPLGVFNSASDMAGWKQAYTSATSTPTLSVFRGGSTTAQVITPSASCTGCSQGDNMIYSLSANSATSWSGSIYDMDKKLTYANSGSLSLLANKRPIVIGRSYDDPTGTGYHSAKWDWVRVRQASGTTASFGAPGASVGGTWTLSSRNKSSDNYFTEPGAWTNRIEVPITYAGATTLNNFEVGTTNNIDTSNFPVTDHLTVTWIDYTGSEDGFILEKCTYAAGSCDTTHFPAGGYTKIYVPPMGVSGSTVTFPDGATLDNTQYCYRVRAYKGDPNAPTWVTDYSGTTYVCRTAFKQLAPANPAGTAAGSTIALVWDDNSIGESGYKLERCSGSNCDFSTLDVLDTVNNRTYLALPAVGNVMNSGTVVASVSASSTDPPHAAYTDSTVGCAGIFRYRISAYFQGNIGTALGPVTTGDITVGAPPTAPTISGTVSYPTQQQILISWTDANATGVWNSFIIERCTAGTNNTCIGNTDGTDSGFTAVSTITGTRSLNFTDNTIQPGRRYGYRVTTTTNTACGVVASPTSATVYGATTVNPWSAADLYATPVQPSPVYKTDTNAANISITTRTSTEQNFVLKRCAGINCTDFSFVSSLSPKKASGTTFTYTDNTLCPGTAYTYSISPVMNPRDMPLLSNGKYWKSSSLLSGIVANAKNRFSFTRNPAITDGSEPNADFSDVRIYDSIAKTELPYYIYSISGNTAVIYFQAGANSSGIYLMYGNATANSNNGTTISTPYNYPTLGAKVSPAAISPFLSNDGGVNYLWMSSRPLFFSSFAANGVALVTIPRNPAVTDGSEPKADYSDLRFYDSIAKTELQYSIQSGYTATSATVYLKVGANANSNQIYVYYGNAGVGSSINSIAPGAWTHGAPNMTGNTTTLGPNLTPPVSTFTAVTPDIYNVVNDWSWRNGYSSYKYGTATFSDDATIRFAFTATKKVTASGGQTAGFKLTSVPVVPAATYQLKAYIKTALTAGAAKCDVTNTAAGFTSPVTNVMVTGTQGWAELPTDSVTIPSNVSTVDVRCYIDGSPTGSAWFGAVELLAPSNPMVLSATTFDESSLDLSWNDFFGGTANVSANERGYASSATGYNIYSCTDGSGTTCTLVPSPSAPYLVTNQGTYYRVSGLQPNSTNYFKVRAYKSGTQTCGGNGNDPANGISWQTHSNMASASTTSGKPSASPTLTPLTSTSMQVAWPDRTSGDTDYDIYRCDGGGACGFLFNTRTTSSHFAGPSVVASYTLGDSSSGIHDASGTSNWLNTYYGSYSFEDGGFALNSDSFNSTGSISNIDLTAFSIEFDFKFLQNIYSGARVLDFGNQNQTLTINRAGTLSQRFDFLVGSNKVLANVGVNGVNGSDFIPGRWYRVRVVKSGTSLSVHVDGSQVATTSSAPAPVSGSSYNLGVGSVYSPSGIGVLKNLIVYNSATADPVQLTYIDTTVCPGASYQYKVAPYNANWTTSGHEAAISDASTSASSPAFLPPTGLTPKAASGDNTRIDLSWTLPAVSNGQTKFLLKECPGSNCSNQISLTPSTTSYISTGLTPETQYSYQIASWAPTTSCGSMTDNNGTTHDDLGITSAYTTSGAGTGTGFSKHAPLTINWGGGSFIANFPIRVPFTVTSDMNADLSDVRFFDTTANVYLPYWIETKAPYSVGGTVNAWVKSGANNTMALLYGNSSAVSQSNGSAVFEFFDDFATLDAAKWTATASTGYTMNSDDTITIINGAVYSNTPVVQGTQNRVFEMKSKWLNVPGNYSGLNIANAQSTLGSNNGMNAVAYLVSDPSATSNDLFAYASDGAATGYNIKNGAISYTPPAEYVIAGFEFNGASPLSFFVKDVNYVEQKRASGTGTWNQAPYLWLGYYSGAAAGATDVDDIQVDWVRVRPYASAGNPTVTASYWSKQMALTIWNFKPNTPVMIKIIVTSYMKSDLSDLRFYDDTGAELAYWVETKTPVSVGSTAIIWVLTKTSGNIYMNYGNSGASAKSNLGAVFSGATGAGPVAYWPFSEDAGTGSGTTKDLGGNGLDGTFFATTLTGSAYTPSTDTSLRASTSYLGGLWKGYNLKINSGQSMGEIAPIISNSGNYVYIDGKFSYPIANSDTFLIYKDGGGIAGPSGGSTLGNALNLNGASSYVSVADNALLDITGSISVEAWYYYQGTNKASARLISKGVSTSEAYTIMFDATGTKLLFQINSSSNQSPASAALTVGWHHVIGRYDQPNKALSIFVDGVESKTTLASAINITANDYALILGSGLYTSGVNKFCWNAALGISDEVRIFNRALSTSEITGRYNAQQHYAAPSSGAPIIVETGMKNPDGLSYELPGSGAPTYSTAPGTGKYPYKIHLKWNDNSSEESYYEIQYLVRNGSWLTLAKVVNSTEYIDTIGIEPQRTYSYKVKGYRASDNTETPFSNIITVTTPAFNDPAALDHGNCVCTTDGSGKQTCR